jgi:nicotinamidase-related amidase
MGRPLRAPLTGSALHLCIDMQNLFAPGGPWATPWMPRVLPVIQEIAGAFAERTIFTRFITPESPQQMPGTWQQYYKKWHDVTREQLDTHWLELIPALARLVPPALVFDKSRYSAFADGRLLPLLQQRSINTIVVSGSESDVCVLATVLSAVDIGLRVIIVRDGICSSSDEGYNAILDIYHTRYGEQIEVADAHTIMSEWKISV